MTLDTCSGWGMVLTLTEFLKDLQADRTMVGNNKRGVNDRSDFIMLEICLW